MEAVLFAQQAALSVPFTHLFRAFLEVSAWFVCGTKLEKALYVFWEMEDSAMHEPRATLKMLGTK